MLRNVRHKATRVGCRKLGCRLQGEPAGGTDCGKVQTVETVLLLSPNSQAIRDKFGVEPNQLRLYVHYQP